MTYHVVPMSSGAAGHVDADHMLRIAKGEEYDLARRRLTSALAGMAEMPNAASIDVDGRTTTVRAAKFEYAHGDATGDTLRSNPAVSVDVHDTEGDAQFLCVKEPVRETFDNIAPSGRSHAVHEAILRRAERHLARLLDPLRCAQAATAVMRRNHTMLGLAGQFHDLLLAEGRNPAEWTLSMIAGSPYWGRRLAATHISPAQPNRRKFITLATSDGCAAVVPVFPSVVAIDVDQSKHPVIRAVPLHTNFGLAGLAADPMMHVRAARIELPDLMPRPGTPWDKGMEE